MKILQIGKFYPPHKGGMESHLRTLCEGLAGKAEVEVLVSSDGARTVKETLNGIPVVRAGTSFQLRAAPVSLDMLRVIRTTNADLMHVHLPNPAASMCVLASGSKQPVIVTYHSDIVSQKLLNILYGPVLDKFLSRASAIIVTSHEYMASSVVLRRHLNRCRVVPLGLELKHFDCPDSNRVAQVRRQFGDRIILAVGRHVYYKGFEYLIRAMNDVPAQLLLMGDGPLRTKNEALVRRLGLDARVHFLGEVPDSEYSDYYHAADIFAFPSVERSEAFGLVQIEAMAAGKPVVNTRLTSGVPFVSLHGMSGITVPPRDSAALAGALNQLFSQPDLITKYSAGAKERARSLFSMDAMIQNVMRVYEEVHENRIYRT